MSKLSKQRAKESFLENVDVVDKDKLIEEVSGITATDDLYTYFIRKDAFATGTLEDKDINIFLQNVYSDWYFLCKNAPKKDTKTVRLFSDESMKPMNLTGDSCFHLIKNGMHNDILPVFFQYTNRLEDRYFICVRTDLMYNRKYRDVNFDARFYINLPVDKILDFAQEFVNKAYLTEFPAMLKVLNNDYRCDTVIIYTDYEYAQDVLDLIEEIKLESKEIFESVGPVSPLLGNINEYIGFGEQSSTDRTYFATRCRALQNVQRIAGVELLKKGIVSEEEKIIFRKDGGEFTATEYLEYLISKNVVKLVEDKIEELEESNGEESELDKLYAYREDVSKCIDIDEEVDKLKRHLTRNEEYLLQVEGIGESDYDYLAKLYRIFTSADLRILNDHSIEQKKDLVCKQVFAINETFEGVNTREFLDTYFKAKLSMILKSMLDEDLNSVKRSRQSAVLVNLKKKSCEKLRSILNNIVDDGDEGKQYINRCINDYVRILSTGALENVEVMIDGRQVCIDADVSEDIINMLPSIKEELNNMTIDTTLIDNIFDEYGINKDNICLTKASKDIHKNREIEESKDEYEYYYNPDGYLQNL